MRVKKQIIKLGIICLWFSACAITGTKQNLSEFRIIDGDTVKVIYQVEVATDSVSRRRGLMYRKEMPSNHGMLLEYKHALDMAIWMKNTYIPLDIIFIDVNGVIVKIHEGAEPLSTKSITSDGRVRAVLEVNAGQVRAYRIKVGDQVRHASFQGQKSS